MKFFAVLSRSSATVFILAGLVSAWGQNYTLTEWPTPLTGSGPLHVAVVSPTQFYFTESTKNRVGELNTNSFTEWLLPHGSRPHGIVLDANMNVAFCAYAGNYIGVLNPSETTQQLTMYAVPTAAAGPIHLDTELSAGGTPEYFFSEVTANKIGLLDPTAGTITEWAVPTANAQPRGVSVGAGTQVFFAEIAAHKVGMLDTSTNNITEWTIPAIRQLEHLHFANGLVYFGDLATSNVGVLDPVSNIVTEWTAPTPNADVADVFVSVTNFYFSERAGNKIGYLIAQGGTFKLAKFVTTSEIPVVAPVAAASATLPSKASSATPTVSTLTGDVNGSFTEWALPNPTSGPLGMNGTGTTVLFTEYTGSRLASLAPSGQNSQASVPAPSGNRK